MVRRVWLGTRRMNARRAARARGSPAARQASRPSRTASAKPWCESSCSSEVRAEKHEALVIAGDLVRHDSTLGEAARVDRQPLRQRCACGLEVDAVRQPCADSDRSLCETLEEIQ